MIPVLNAPLVVGDFMESRITDQPQIPRGPMQGEESTSTGSNKKQFFSFLF